MQEKAKERLIELYSKQLINPLTDDERAELLDLVSRNDAESVLSGLLYEKWQSLGTLSHAEGISKEAIEGLIEKYNIDKKDQGEGEAFTRQVHRVHFLRTAWFRYAAAILVILGVAAYVFVAKQPAEKPIIVAELNKEPGTDKAILTLSDGRQVVLENSNNQSITDGDISIGNTNGILSYSAVSASETNSIGINTMTTPRGGQYQLVLPDGSRVWLNSASSLKYPVVFSGKQRMVELSGEGYFEVKGNKKMPFIVKTQKGEVLVLGTAFNINSYSDEPLSTTTLISGSIKISLGNDAKIIKPGQQVEVSNEQPGILMLKENVDINQVIAWQKGIFEFKGANLDIIARQLSKWYDVEVKTSMTDSKDIKLSGGITKKTPLKTLLRMLEANGIKSKYEKNVIILY